MFLFIYFQPEKVYGVKKNLLGGAFSVAIGVCLILHLRTALLGCVCNLKLKIEAPIFIWMEFL